MDKNKKTVNLSKSNLRYRVLGIVVLMLLSLGIIFPGHINKGIDWVNKTSNLGIPTLPASGFNLGLDLQGGAHLVYQANLGGIKDAERANSLEGVRDVIERRVRGGLGVAEPIVQTTRVGEDYRIIVELPGINDTNQAIKMIGETPVLEFKEKNNEVARSLTADEKKQMDDYNANATKKANQALTELRAGSKFEDVVAKYTEDDKSKNNGGSLGFVTEDTNKLAYDWAAQHKVGDLSASPVSSTGGLNIYKKLNEKDGAQQVEISHILICYRGSEGCDNPVYSKSEAKDRIEKIKQQATPDTFADFAKQYTTEQGGAEKGGYIGWLSKGQSTVADFENSAFSIAKGAISDVIETKYGYDLIYKKDERVPKEYEVATVFVKTKTESDILPPVDEWKETGLTGKQLSRAEVATNNQTGEIEVSLQFNAEGTKLFGDITTRNVGKPVAIFLDGTPISTPNVNQPITSGSAVIYGNFTLEEAQTLARRLNSGALPVPVELVTQQKVDASLGSDSLHKSIYAGLLGFLAVILFMILYYRFPGIVAVLALALYSALSLAIFKLIGVTLTLSGIAGFILSVGMAVDANVLIFERLKEELRLRKTLRTGLEEAFTRSWPSIRDSNVTTLISCVFLIWLGGGFVRGFAVTLAIGVLVSMFTAITITRTLLRLTSSWFNEYGNWSFWGYQGKNKEENK